MQAYLLHMHARHTTAQTRARKLNLRWVGSGAAGVRAACATLRSPAPLPAPGRPRTASLCTHTHTHTHMEQRGHGGCARPLLRPKSCSPAVFRPSCAQSISPFCAQRPSLVCTKHPSLLRTASLPRARSVVRGHLVGDHPLHPLLVPEHWVQLCQPWVTLPCQPWVTLSCQPWVTLPCQPWVTYSVNPG